MLSFGLRGRGERWVAGKEVLVYRLDRGIPMGTSYGIFMLLFFLPVI
jgi:hypothetical protein